MWRLDADSHLYVITLSISSACIDICTDPGSQGKEWEYLTFNGYVRVKLVPDETGTLAQPYVLASTIQR